MKEWLTAREIAAEALPDLPATERGIQKFAAAAGWNDCIAYCRTRKGRGGGFEYHIALFPTLAKLEYSRRHLTVAAAPAAAPDLVLGEGLSERAARERDARLAIVAAYEVFSQNNRLGEASRTQIFVDRYNMGSQAVESWIRTLIPQISKRSLARWRAAKFVGRADRLAVDRSAARKGKGLIETANGGAVETFILGWLAASPLLSAQVIRGYVEEEFGAELVDVDGVVKPLPPLRTFQHTIAKLRETKKVALTKVTNPDKYRSTMKLRGTNAYSWVAEPNQLWMIDASPVDALCIDGRWSLYAAIDVAPRRLKITLSRTPRASSVCLMLRTAIQSWGVPKRIKTDNGSDFAAEETQRFLHSLDIDPDPSDAYCPDQKPFIERVIGTFQHEVGPQLPGFIGHDVTDRKAIEERKSFADRLGEDDAKTFAVSLTAAQLQSHINDWLEYVYDRRAHGTTGISPHDAVAASTAPIARVDERALDVLLMPAPDKDGRRRMGPHGIKVGGHKYLSHSILVGTDVFVRLDPIDMGKIYVFAAEDGRFLDVAECAELLDVDRPAFVKAKKALYEAMVAEDVARIRKETRRLVAGPSGIERTIALAKRKAAETGASNANVVSLPKREIAHETPAIREALKVGRDAAPAPLSAKAAEILAREKAAAPTPAEPVASNVRPLRNQETRQQRFRRALEFEARIAAGEDLPTADAMWLGGYQKGSEYRSMTRLYEDGGEQVLR